MNYFEVALRVHQTKVAATKRCKRPTKMIPTARSNQFPRRPQLLAIDIECNDMPKPVRGMLFQAMERAPATAVCFETSPRLRIEVERKEQELLLKSPKLQVHLVKGDFGKGLLETSEAVHKTSNCRENSIQQPIQASSYNESSHPCFSEQVCSILIPPPQ